MPFAYDESDDDWRRIDRIASEAGCRTSALRNIADKLVEDPRAWAAVRALAEELAGRFARDGSALVRGDEALAIMDDYDVRLGMRLPCWGLSRRRAQPVGGPVPNLVVARRGNQARTLRDPIFG